MYNTPIMYNPFHMAKSKLSDNARRLAITQTVLTLISFIYTISLIYLLYEFIALVENVDDIFYYYDFLFTAFETFLLILVLMIIQFVILIVNYIFFFLLASSFNNLGNLETRIAGSAKKASSFIMIGLIVDIIYRIVSFFFSGILIYLIGLVSLVFIALGFWFMVETFKDLTKIGLFNRKSSYMVFYSTIVLLLSEIINLVALNQNLSVGAALLIVYLVIYALAQILFIIGLFKLSNQASQIITPPQPVVQPPIVIQQQPYPQQPQMYVQYPNQPPQPIQQQNVETPVEEKLIFCSNCGEKSKSTLRFCKHCGNNLED